MAPWAQGPVFPESYTYLKEAGVSVQRGVLQKEAAAVLRAYGDGGGPVYNGSSSDLTGLASS